MSIDYNEDISVWWRKYYRKKMSVKMSVSHTSGTTYMIGGTAAPMMDAR